MIMSKFGNIYFFPLKKSKFQPPPPKKKKKVKKFLFKDIFFYFEGFSRKEKMHRYSLCKQKFDFVQFVRYLHTLSAPFYFINKKLSS